MISKNESLSRSFMCLSFVTAALLVVAQLKIGLSSSDAEQHTLAPFSSSFIAFPDRPPSNRADSSLPALSLLPRSGWALDLQTALNPNPLAQRSRLIVDLSDRQVYLFQDGIQVTNYEISIGQTGWETPTGQFQVITMQVDPVWQHPFTGELFPSGAQNPLGSRWIGFWTDGIHQIGLHGTNQDELIGQAVSHGCIRLRNADIQSLYTQVAIGTTLLVRP
jgi:lipoprotein-anchoring transpeptidase ErfK/SrfK